MEPYEFNDRIENLVKEALESGLHPNHVENILQSNLDDVGVYDG